MPLQQVFYIKDNAEWPLTEKQIKQRFPQTSFPTEFVPPDGYEAVFTTPMPQYGSATQGVNQVTPVKVDGVYQQAWEVYDLTADQIEAIRKSKIPAQVSPRQIRQALTQAGLRAGVEAAVAAGDQDLKDWWEFATAFERQHPMVIGMATGLGVTEQQLDDLFVLAGTL